MPPRVEGEKLRSALNKSSDSVLINQIDRAVDSLEFTMRTGVSSCHATIRVPSGSKPISRPVVASEARRVEFRMIPPFPCSRLKAHRFHPLPRPESNHRLCGWYRDRAVRHRSHCPGTVRSDVDLGVAERRGKL